MDMSVKLNLSYPTVKPVEPTTERPAAKPVAAVEAITPVKEATDKGLSEAEKVKSAVKDIEKFLASSRRNLEFSTDEESGRIVVKVIASETGELIRQLPSEEALKIAHSLSDVNSLLFNAKA
ncbi:flagellar protein FlaG [Pseudomonas sp. BIGb0427]|uniref:Flagellar biosynthesis protein FlaG n=1 Tax=Pseudomonas vranovensis TaxID=321661 RepID=A0A423CU58_9PSED|nr:MULTISPECIES: flagellar protein FlaG [Pseudomonas]NLU59825.1 flagellar protein FlaG [Pseudomonas sp. BIGb0427]QPG60788.1 flagellar protein FlaG [Pseudomonas sp. BIGb0427]ROL62841.1 flagellar biosynthesis protein FlaG [Pseudomonas vranovensis]UVM68400.1 flagellar protein FlaG [Pseudomonas sp. B21-009]